MKSIILALAAAMTLSALTARAASAATDIVVNGSFENSFAGLPHSTSDTELYAGKESAELIAGWTVFADELSWIGPTNTFGLSAPAGGGSYFLDLTGLSDDGTYGGIRQSLATTPGATYQLSFQLGGKQGYGLPAGLVATAGGTSQTFLTTNPDPDNLGFWQTETLNFVANSATTDLSFLGSNSDHNVGLDLVSVTQIAAATVSAAPEPGAWSLMLAGVGFAGLALRRRSAERGGAPIA